MNKILFGITIFSLGYVAKELCCKRCGKTDKSKSNQ